MQTGTWNGFICPLCCDALTTLRFRHLGHHFLKPRDFADISVSKTLYLLQNMGQLNYWAKDCIKGQKWSRKKGNAVPYLMYSTLCLTTMLHLADVTYAGTTKRFEFICTEENSKGKTNMEIIDNHCKKFTHLAVSLSKAVFLGTILQQISILWF